MSSLRISFLNTMKGIMSMENVKVMGFNTIKMEVGLRDHGREVNQMGLELQFTLIKNSILGNLNKVFCMDSADHSFTTVTSIGDTFIKEDCKD